MSVTGALLLGLLVSGPSLEPPRNALQAQSALWNADWARRSMHFGICWDYNRKAEVSRFDAEYRRLARLIEARYHLSMTRREIILDDRRDCDESDTYSAYRTQYAEAIATARRALGLEN